MASLKCNNCGYGIHYHDEPDGTEHIAIPFSTWEFFYSTNVPVVRYLLDGPEDYLIIWRCQKCGCLHTFLAGGILVTRAYAPCEITSTAKTDNGIKYRVFDDRLFDAVAEDDATAKEFEAYGKYRDCYYALIGDDYLLTFDDADFTHITGCYQAIETPTE